MALPATRRFTVDDYYKMAEVGILREGERVELMDGEIVKHATVSPRHAARTDCLARLGIERFAGAARTRIRSPVRLSRYSELEPDIALARPEQDRGRSYRVEHPTAEDVLLIVEVADSSLDYDLGRKARLYARHGIPELWVLDQRNDRLVLHREPTPRGYAAVSTLERGESVSPLAFSEMAFTVDELLGAPGSSSADMA